MATPKRKPTRKPATAAKKPVARKKTTVKPGVVGSRTSPARKTTPVTVKKADDTLVSIIGDMKALYQGKTVHILNVPFMERDVARVLGAEWIERVKSYVYVGEIVPERLKPYLSEDYSYARWIEDQINGRIKPAQKPQGSYFAPKPHQVEGIESIKNATKAGWRGFIEADSTGLGKSLVGLLGASEAAKLKGFTQQKKANLLIITPNGAIPHWRNTIRHTQQNNLRIMVINYEQYKKLLTVPKAAQDAKKAKTKNKHIASSGQPFIKWDFIICDESQKVKNYTSQRTQAFERIAEYAKTATQAPFVIYMSATIGQQPLELAYLAPIIGQAAKKHLTMETWPAWLKEAGFHVSKKGSTWTWVKPASPQDAIARQQQRQDVERLGAILFNPKAPSIRRKPEDIAGWPELNRIAQPVELSAEGKKEYQKLWTEFRKSMLLRPHGKNPSSVLAEQLRFAQKASLLRVKQTVEQIVDLLDSGYQVCVSVRFIETLERIKSELKALGLDASEFSGRPFINNEKERLLFQKGVNKVILFTVEEAVSFHAKEQLPDGTTASPFPRATLIHDQRYSALSMTQITGRAHRDGQNSNAYFLYAEDTVEEKILSIMMNKLENMSVLSGDTEEDVIVEILEKVLA